jgi:hypothetical protein
MENFADYSMTDSSGVCFLNNFNMDPNAKNYSNCDILGSFYDVVQKTDLSTAFGYEQDNGSVLYVLVGHMTAKEILEKEYIKTRTVPKGVFNKLSCPLEGYIDSKFLLSSETDIRVLFKLNGEIVLKDKEGNRILF